MPTTLTKQDLRTIHATMSRCRPPFSPPTLPEELVEINRVLEVVEQMVHEVRPTLERGKKLLEWRLANAHAPTMNAYVYMKPWMRGELAKKLDGMLLELLDQYPALTSGHMKQRWVRVTRFTNKPKQIDEASADSIGGKMPIDALVRAGILHDDRPDYVHRQALVRATNWGNTHVLIELFEMRDEGEVRAHEDDEPKDAPVEQVKRKRKGILKREVEDNAPASAQVPRRAKRSAPKASTNRAPHSKGARSRRV